MNNEFDWINSVSPKKHHHSSTKVGIGDDAAIYAHEQGFETVVAVDTMVEGIHFAKQTMPIKFIGYKVLAVNLSDLAAMGAIPLYYLVSIAVPKQGWTQRETSIIYEGMTELAEDWGLDLIGGDTVSTKDALVLTVTVIGKIETNRRLLRSQAQVGDVVFTTGELGLSSFGLEHLLVEGFDLANTPKFAPFIRAHQRPTPQLRAGRLLAESGYRISLNDVSDGIAHEVKEIAEASHVTIVIDWDRLPIPSEFLSYSLKKQHDWVLYGGEDFQLVGTIAATEWENLVAIFRKSKLPLFKIGTVESAGETHVLLNEANRRTPIIKTGYQHF